MNEQLIAAAQQALKALQKGTGWMEHGEAITTLRTAIEAAKSRQALDKMAENARELGLDYEPVIDKSAAIRIATALGWTPPAAAVQEHQINQLEKFKNHVLANADALGVVLDTPAAPVQDENLYDLAMKADNGGQP